MPAAQVHRFSSNPLDSTSENCLPWALYESATFSDNNKAISIEERVQLKRINGSYRASMYATRSRLGINQPARIYLSESVFNVGASMQVSDSFVLDIEWVRTDDLT